MYMQYLINCSFHATAIVSFGKVSTEQKEEVQKLGLAIYSWDEFLSLVRFSSEEILLYYSCVKVHSG